MINPTLAISLAQFTVRTRGEGGTQKLEFHPALAGDWRELLRAVLLASEARPGAPAEELERKGVAADVIAYLAGLGVVVEPEEVPADVSFSCDLAKVTPGPTTAARVELNPGLYLQTNGALPAPLVARVSSAGALAKGRPVLWVDDPGSGILMPFTLAGPVEKVVRDLVEGKLSPARVPARWRSVCEQATILVPPRYVETRKRHWQRACERAAESIRAKEHAVLRNLLNPLQLQSLQRYVRALRNEGYLRQDSVQVKERVVKHNEPMAGFFHQPLCNLITRFAPEPIKPSYSFAAHYQAGAELARHTDREQCVWNASFAVDSTPESTSRTAWPLHIESRGKPYKVRLGSGDVVIYSGTKNPHWREAQPVGHVSTLIFYHFVPLGFTGELD